MKAFTLVELIVVIALVGVLLSLCLPGYTAALDRESGIPRTNVGMDSHYYAGGHSRWYPWEGEQGRVTLELSGGRGVGFIEFSDGYEITHRVRFSAWRGKMRLDTHPDYPLDASRVRLNITERFTKPQQWVSVK